VLEKVPPHVADLIAPLWVWVVGLLGASAGYLEDFKLDDGWRIWVIKGLTKGTSSALAAVLTYHAILAMNVQDENMRVVLVGIAAHMGTESLKVLSALYRAKVGK
jgi:hypothetical protein